jgi:hypothetical protein
VRARTLRRLCPVDSEDTDRALVAHTLLRDANDLRTIFVERDPLHGSGEFPGIQALAGGNLPELHHVISRPRNHEVR